MTRKAGHMRYEVDKDDLCIRIPIEVIAGQVFVRSRGTMKSADAAATAMALGRELVHCETAGDEPHLNAALDAALGRVVESADPSIEPTND